MDIGIGEDIYREVLGYKYEGAIMHKGIAVLGLCLLALQARAASVLPAYECHRSASPIAIDGKLDEWKSIPSVNFYVPASAEKLVRKAEGKVLWDDKYLYIAMKTWDKDIWSYMTERDSPVCHEDVLEAFINPNTKDVPYYAFEINAIGTVYDACFLQNMTCMGSRWKLWNCRGLKIGTSIKGTLNNPGDIDEYWSLEMAIPFSSLTGKAPKYEDEWTFQLAGYDYSVYLPPEGVELFVSIPLSKVDFHMPAEWQTLRFVQ
jgi:hypothetical protein